MRNNAYRRAVTVHRNKRADVHFSVVSKRCRVVCRGVSAAAQERFVRILVDGFLAICSVRVWFASRLICCAPDFYKESVTFAYKHQRFGGFAWFHQRICIQNTESLHFSGSLFRLTFQAEVKARPSSLFHGAWFSRHAWIICRKSSPSLSYLPVFLVMSE